MPSTDRVTLDLQQHEATQDRRQRSYDAYEREAMATVRQNCIDEGMTETDADAFLLTADGQDLVEAEVGILELGAFDADVDRRIDEYRERNR